MGFLPQLPDYLSWTKFTPVIPKIYLNAKSPEQWAKEVFCEIGKITQYLKLIADTINNCIIDYEEFKKSTDKTLKSIQKQIDDLSSLNREDNNIYDVTQGKWTNSQEAMRNMYRELAVFGQRVKDMQNHTVAENAQQTTLEHAVIGNYTIEGHKDPRITPIGQ